MGGEEPSEGKALRLPVSPSPRTLPVLGGPFGVSPLPPWLWVPKFGSDSRLPARRTAPAGAREPGRAAGGEEKEAATQERKRRRGGGGGRREGSRGGAAAPGEGSVPGSRASPPPAPSAGCGPRAAPARNLLGSILRQAVASQIKP